MKAPLSVCVACMRRAPPAAPRRSTLADVHSALEHRVLVLGASQSRSASTDIAAEIRESRRGIEPSSEPKSESKSPSAKREKQRLERRVNASLPYLDDHWKLGQHVETLLDKDNFDEALLLTQTASKRADIPVVWNHLIQYQMRKGEAHKAVKLFNDMKKRAQLPNIRTYTILFHGLKDSPHPKWAVTEAVKHYNVLMANPRLEANTFHLNAVLAVCSKANDVDQLFLISRTANDSVRAPTAYTYTIILNTLRVVDAQMTKTLPIEQKRAQAVRVGNQAKGLWIEVMEKWRNGQLVLDEHAVCAMGRILLLQPTTEEKYQVLDLLEQTMNVPNLHKTPGSPLVQDPDMEHIGSKTELVRPVAGQRGLYVTPGRNALSLVLMTLATTKLTKLGIKYWNLFVRHYGIVPDLDIWYRLFGMLKRSNSSTHTAAVIEYLPDEFAQDRIYRLAMQTCVDDHANPHVMDNANKVLDESVKRLKTPDLQTLRLYLRAALVSHKDMRKKAEGGDVEVAILAYGKQITESLVKLWEPFRKMHRQLFETPDPVDRKALAARYNEKCEVMALARLMCSAFDKVTNQKMLPPADLAKLRPISAQLQREVVSFYSTYSEMQAQIKRKAGGDTDSSPLATSGDGADGMVGGQSRTDATLQAREGGDLLQTDDQVPNNSGSIWGKDYVRKTDFIWDVKSARERWLNQDSQAPTASRRSAKSRDSKWPQRRDREPASNTEAP